MDQLVLDEVYDIVDTSFWRTLPGYGVLFLGVILLGLASYGILRVVKNYWRGTSKDRALKNLRKLSAQVESGQSELKAVYQRLTMIAKGFTQWRYGMPRGATDYEFITYLNSTENPLKSRKEVERVFSEAQVVKFGQLEVPKEQVLRDIEAVRFYIEQSGNQNE